MKHKRGDRVFLEDADGYTGYATVMECLPGGPWNVVIREDGEGRGNKEYDERYGLSDKKYWRVCPGNMRKASPSLITKILYTLKDFITRITRRK
jgi:hypothetical protein